MKTEEVRLVEDGYLILPKVFTKKGFTFTQLKRVKDWAIYKLTSGKIVSFEVIKIQRHDGYEVAGTKIAPSETYPSSEQWGIFGWTLTNQEESLKKFNKLIENESTKTI